MLTTVRLHELYMLYAILSLEEGGGAWRMFKETEYREGDNKVYFIAYAAVISHNAKQICFHEYMSFHTSDI